MTTIKCQQLPYKDYYSKKLILDNPWQDDEDHDMFCDCCGANYKETTNDKTKARAGKGITVYAGHIAEGKVSKVNSINHINTKNGPLTVVARTKKAYQR